MSKQIRSRVDKRYTPNDDIWTPSWAFEQFGITFDLDVCSSPLKTNVPALRKLTIEEDGLATLWEGKVWMNPPYSNPTPWVQKWRDHGNGLGIVPLTKGYWFMNLWHDERVSMSMLDKHMKFVKPDGSLYGIFMPTVFIAIGEGNKEILERLEFGYVR